MNKGRDRDKNPFHRKFNEGCSLEQQFDCFVKGLLVATESLLQGVDSKECKKWITLIVKRYFKDSENLAIALEKVDYYYGYRCVEDETKNDLIERSRFLAERLRGTKWFREAVLLSELAEIQETRKNVLDLFEEKKMGF